MGFLRNVVGTVVSESLASVVAYYTDLQFYALVCFGIQWVATLYAVPKQTERFLDVTGSFTYALLALLAYTNNGPISWRGSLLAAFVWLWCIRLGAFLFLRISECGEDKRFVEIRVNPLRFFSVWNIQGLWVLLTVLPVLLALAHGAHDPEVSPFDVVGSGLWVVGYLMEVTADYQKTQLRRNENNKGKFIQSDLWHYSRHPNYCGEIMMWVGVFLVTAHTLPTFALQCWAAVSPTFDAAALYGVGHPTAREAGGGTLG